MYNENEPMTADAFLAYLPGLDGDSEMFTSIRLHAMRVMSQIRGSASGTYWRPRAVLPNRTVNADAVQALLRALACAGYRERSASRQRTRRSNDWRRQSWQM